MFSLWSIIKIHNISRKLFLNFNYFKLICIQAFQKRRILLIEHYFHILRIINILFYIYTSLSLLLYVTYVDIMKENKNIMF